MSGYRPSCVSPSSERQTFNFYTSFRFYTPVSNFIHQGLILCTSVRFKLVGSECRHLCPVIDHRVRFVTLKSDFGDQRPILDTSFRLQTLVQIFDTSFSIQRVVSFSYFPLQNALRLKRLLLIFFSSGFFLTLTQMIKRIYSLIPALTQHYYFFRNSSPPPPPPTTVFEPSFLIQNFIIPLILKRKRNFLVMCKLTKKRKTYPLITLINNNQDFHLFIYSFL